MNKAPGTHILIAEAFRHRVGATGWVARSSASERDAVSQRSGIRWRRRDRRLLGLSKPFYGVLFSGVKRRILKNIPEGGAFCPDWAGSK